MHLKAFQAQHSISMERFYDMIGVSRQAVHKQLKANEQEKGMMAEITREVAIYRLEKDRRAGSRSLYYNLEIKRRYALGVNKFERLMSRYSLTTEPLHVRVMTTKSCLQSWNYSNLTDGLVLNDINQLVVGDLTYVSLGKYRYYLFCLTDVYSARVTGYCFHTRMRTTEAMDAMEMWVRLRKPGCVRQCIHHTDGGGQYFSKIYIKALGGLDIQISVARNCLENGYAEQRNGLIKHHLLPTVDFSHGAQLDKEIERILYVYNYERRQESLGWRSPVEFETYISTLREKPTRKLYSRNAQI